MQAFFAGLVLAITLFYQPAAWAFAPSEDAALGFEEVSDLPSHTLLGKPRAWMQKPRADEHIEDDGSITFFGSTMLPPTFGNQDAGMQDNVMQFFRARADAASLELVLLDMTRIDENERRYSFVQASNGVPIAGTFALAQIRNGYVRYARRLLVDAPASVVTSPDISARAAQRSAQAALRGFRRQAELDVGPAKIEIVFAQGAFHLAYKVAVESHQPDASYDIFVDARTGRALAHVLTHQQAVSGEVTAQVEPSCQGEQTVSVGLPHVRLSDDIVTQRDGGFSSAGDIDASEAQLSGPYIKVSDRNGDPVWRNQLFATPTYNTLSLDSAPLSMVDPFFYAHQARGWLRERLQSFADIETSRVWQWTEKQLAINVNLPGSCNASYNGALNFYSASGGCNNTGRTNKIVYHEYGHGVHQQLAPTAMTPRLRQLGEGVADYIAATITNDPNISGLTSCSAPVENQRTKTVRTCVNAYTYCKGSKCTAHPPSRRGSLDAKAEVHTVAPVMCGALWEVREKLRAKYGNTEGLVRADRFFLRFLSVATDVSGSYRAAIAADDDNDNDPSNGTQHSCEINAAFLGAPAGSGGHFPDAASDRVPCLGVAAATPR